jgi:hypothetical protein
MNKPWIALSLALVAVPALGGVEQQSRMKTCNAEARLQSLKGETRKAFMKDCLSTKKGAAPQPVANRADSPPEKTEAKPLTAQQAKMKRCNVEAKGMKGDERRGFMSRCLKA